jgi:ABC-type lipoprotein release transport system permease subunit
MIIQLAWRNIWRNKVRSMVIMLSVSIGLFAGIAVLALYKGMMQSRIRTVIYFEVTHIQIHQKEFKKDYEPFYTLPGGDSMAAVIGALKQVKLVARRTIVQGMLSTTTGSAGVQINGVEPAIEYQASQLDKKIITGSSFHSNKKNEILIGKKLADKVKLATGAKLVLTFTDTAGNIVSSAFRVAGIYESQNTSLDEVNVYVEMKTLNDLLLTGKSFHEIGMLLNNDDDLASVQQQLKYLFPSYLIESWKEISPETDLMVKTVDEYSYIIMIIILIALAFGIINTMLMAILERTREIGMMVALGTTRLRVFLLVLFETIFLTIGGTPLGILAGLFTTNYYNKHGLDLSGMGKEMMASFGFNTIIYPSFPVEKLLAIMLLVIGTAVLSCLLPAFKALRMQPVEALRR